MTTWKHILKISLILILAGVIATLCLLIAALGTTYNF